MEISIKNMNELIDKEIKYAKQVNPITATGMEKIKEILNIYFKETKYD